MFSRLEIWRSEEGQTTVEYAVVLVLVIAMAISCFVLLQPAIDGVVGVVLDRLTALF
jgi:Flp pilus assembly pilin Flp